MSNTLTLATRLRALESAVVHDAIVQRELLLSPATLAGIKDYFDLADVLLEHGAVQQCLTRQDRGILSALTVLAFADAPMGQSDVAATLRELGSHTANQADVGASLLAATQLLLAYVDGGEFTVYKAVGDQLRSWPVFGLPSLQELAGAAAPGALEPVPDVDRRFIDRLAAERAFAATSSVTELLLELERQPARELAKGGIALPDTKRIASAMSVDLETVGVYLSLAERGRLVSREGGKLMTTESGNSWLGHSTASRWRQLASAWFTRLPDDIRVLLSERSHAVWGDGLRSYLDWLYPAGGEWMTERVDSYTRDAELLGITAGQAPSGPGAYLLADDGEGAEEAIRPLLPAEVDKVYLQHDLTVVAPGPLAPAIDERMRELADVESRALATTFRISAASVNRALTGGETSESLHDFLESISLTGIPQPLDYLITEGAARYGLIRAGELSGEGAEPGSVEYGAQSYLCSEETNLLHTVAVDQSLSSLGLARVGPNRLVSRFPLDVVFWSLSDARYPVAAEDEAGEIIALRRHRVASSRRPAPEDTIAELLNRLQTTVAENEPAGVAQGDATDQAWLAKQLEAAIRDKQRVTVSVTMPGGNTVELTLEPTSLASGRLRGRDSKSEIERTLPLASITAVKQEGSPS